MKLDDLEDFLDTWICVTAFKHKTQVVYGLLTFVSNETIRLKNASGDVYILTKDIKNIRQATVAEAEMLEMVRLKKENL